MQASTPEGSTWLAFQEFARTHEDPKHAAAMKRACANLGLDSDLWRAKQVDRSKSGPGLPKRVLFLTTVQALFFMTDRWTFHTYMALAAKRSEYHVLLWGIGLPGFHTNETLSDNIQRWFVDPKLDVVVTTWNYHRTFVGHETWKDWRFSSSYLDHIHKRVARDKKKRGAAPLPELEASILTKKRRATEFHSVVAAGSKPESLLPGAPVIVAIFHEIEAREQTDLAEIRPQLVIVQVEQQLGVLASRQRDLCGGERRNGACPQHPVLGAYLTEFPGHALLAYMPHGVHAPFFFESPVDSTPTADGGSERDPCDHVEKMVNVLIIGALNGHIYPLRAAAVTAKRWTKELSQYQHPGYKEELEWERTLEGMCHVFFRESFPQQRSYAGHMKSARFCLLGSRSFNVGFEGVCDSLAWPLRKYAEAMAAGCIVVGDPPSDYALAKHVALRLTNQKPEQLGDTLQKLVAKYKDDGRGFADRYCRAARRTIARNYTYDAVLDSHFSPALKAYWRGQRGVFQDTLSPILVRNDEHCETFDGRSTTWRLVGNNSLSF